MKNELLIADANILIDYYLADPELISMLCKEFKVKISKVVMGEIEQFTYAEAIDFGIEIMETDDSIRLNLPELNRLSFQDKSCIVLTQKLNGSCLTNDKNLKKYLEKEGFKTFWGLEMILLLVSKNYLDKARAALIADKIFENNFWYKDDVKNTFRDKLQGM